MVKSAYQNDQEEWIYPQMHYRNGKVISKKKLHEQIANNPLVQEAIQIEPRIEKLIDLAKKQRCEYGYSRIDTLYSSYKPQIAHLVGWRSPRKELRTTGPMARIPSQDSHIGP